MKLEPIRLRLVPKKPIRDRLNPRDAFWRSFQSQETVESEAWEISEMEGRIRQSFGSQLQEHLAQMLTKTLRDAESALGVNFVDYRYFLDRTFERSRDKYEYDRAIEAYTRHLDRRQETIRENAGLRRLQERVIAASSISFSTRIAGYSRVLERVEFDQRSKSHAVRLISESVC